MAQNTHKRNIQMTYDTWKTESPESGPINKDLYSYQPETRACIACEDILCESNDSDFCSDECEEYHFDKTYVS
jgi:recombinational DNA repair protein RecR